MAIEQAGISRPSEGALKNTWHWLSVWVEW